MKRRNLVPRHVYSKKAWYITRGCRQLLQRSVSVIAKMKEVERYCKIVRCVSGQSSWYIGTKKRSHCCYHSFKQRQVGFVQPQSLSLAQGGLLYIQIYFVWFFIQRSNLCVSFECLKLAQNVTHFFL